MQVASRVISRITDSVNDDAFTDACSFMAWSVRPSAGKLTAWGGAARERPVPPDVDSCGHAISDMGAGPRRFDLGHDDTVATVGPQVDGTFTLMPASAIFLAIMPIVPGSSEPGIGSV